MGIFTNYRQREVLRLEPSRAAASVGAILFLLVAGTASTATALLAMDSWPSEIRQPEVDLSDRTLLLIAGGLAALALVALVSAWYNLSRWRLARRVVRASNDPRFAPLLPDHTTAFASERAISPPPLDIKFVKPRRLAKTPKLRPVTPTSNVIGHPPLQIAYLRLFDNQPRARTFLESAWREFGYVHLLRSATSITRTEYKQSRRLGELEAMFVADDESLVAALESAPNAPYRRGRLVLRNVAPTRVSVRDRYGSYPVRAILCHGAYWRRAVDILLSRVDLVVIDLSGFTERNQSTAYELQRVIDGVAIERVVMLCDPRSSKKYLQSAILAAWTRMDAASPNAHGAPRWVVVGVTDTFRRRTSQQGDHDVEQVSLESSRRVSRRLAAAAQLSLEEARSGRAQSPMRD